MERFVPVNTPVFNGNEKKYLMDCIDTGWISSAGHYIEDFEKGMSNLVGQEYGVAVCNGTVALEDAVLALNLPEGSEVIMPDFTIISCLQAIVKAGLVPVMIDCDPYTWNMDVSKVAEKVTAKTKAIMVAHIYGLPVDMDTVWAIAKDHNLVVIEDAAEAHGLTYRGKQCGGLGDISCFSFFPNKHITSGEGGMVLTNNEAYAVRARNGRNLFFDSERKYIHEEFGNNYRMTNMQAAVGLAQLEQIEKTVIKKREIGKKYQEGLADIKGIRLPVEKTDYADNIYWVFGVVIEDSELSADLIMKKLADKGIQTRHFFYPMHKQPALIKSGVCKEEELKDQLYSNANYICEHGFYIPSGLGLTDEDQDYVIKVMHEIFQNEV